jgi:hypothetical protein
LGEVVFAPVARTLRACLLALALAAPTAALAQDVQALATKAIEAERAGKPADALAALEEAVTAMWLKMPLGFRHALYVKEPAKGFGVYDPLGGTEVDSGGTLHIYAEPIGFGWISQGDVHTIGVSFDIQLKTPDGKVVFERKEFLKAQVQSRTRTRDFFANMRLNLGGAPAGDYSVTITANDPATGKSGSFTLPFKIKG